MKQYLLPLALIALSIPTIQAADQVPAFPGAEGHGRYVTGGRGYEVYHVTNLNDSGSGSLRDAVSKDNRIIVFDVGGYIDLKSDLSIGRKNISILGQTAPAPGITLRYYTLQFKENNASNIIVRFIRCRRSQVKNVNDGADAFWGRKCTNIMIDHCSLSWSIDEIASFYDNRNFSLQWCTIGEGLANPGHSKGEHSYGGIWGGKNASFHHNFLCHVQNRCPRFNGARYGWEGYDKTQYSSTVDAERVDFRNCVMYNWGTGSACYGGPGGGYINIINNYYKAGPGTKNKYTVTQVSVATSGNADSKHPELYDLSSRYYVKGNYVTAASSPQNYDWSGVKYDSGHLTYNGARYIKDPAHQFGENVDYVKISGIDCVKLQLDQPVDAGDVTTHTAANSYKKVMDYSGASLWRDAVDTRYMEEARTGTVNYKGDVAYSSDFNSSGTKGIVDFINDPEGTAVNGVPSFPVMESTSRPANFDTDRDGIPDEWEVANGLNPNDKSDGNAKTIDTKGWYTNFEVYANSLVEHIIKAQNEDALTGVDEYFPAYKTSGIEEIYSNVAREIIEVQYYNLSGVRIAEPGQGISIRRLIYSDGSVETDKVLK